MQFEYVKNYGIIHWLFLSILVIIIGYSTLEHKRITFAFENTSLELSSLVENRLEGNNLDHVNYLLWVE